MDVTEITEIDGQVELHESILWRTIETPLIELERPLIVDECTGRFAVVQQSAEVLVDECRVALSYRILRRFGQEGIIFCPGSLPVRQRLGHIGANGQREGG